MADLVRNVTRDNYLQLGLDFIALNGGTGFIIALKNGIQQGVEYQQSLKQWGAWYAFFVRIRHAAWTMLKREFYTVPAEWPHMFTTDSTIVMDHDSGTEFERRYLDEKADEEARYAHTAEQARAVIERALQGFPSQRRKPLTPPSHLAEPQVRDIGELLETDLMRSL